MRKPGTLCKNTHAHTRAVAALRLLVRKKAEKARRRLKGAKARGKEMSLSRSIGSYYKLPKSDPNAVYLLPTAIYLLQCCFIAANIVWAGQCDNSLFPWKLYKINLTAQQTINTAIKISVNVNWCYSTPRLLLPNFSWQLIF